MAGLVDAILVDAVKIGLKFVVRKFNNRRRVDCCSGFEKLPIVIPRVYILLSANSDVMLPGNGKHPQANKGLETQAAHISSNTTSDSMCLEEMEGHLDATHVAACLHPCCGFHSQVWRCDITLAKAFLHATRDAVAYLVMCCRAEPNQSELMDATGDRERHDLRVYSLLLCDSAPGCISQRVLLLSASLTPKPVN